MSSCEIIKGKRNEKGWTLGQLLKDKVAPGAGTTCGAPRGIAVESSAAGTIVYITEYNAPSITSPKRLKRRQNWWCRTSGYSHASRSFGPG